jgi:hypothetical protein
MKEAVLLRTIIGVPEIVERTQKLLYKNAWKPRVPHYIDNRIT